MKEKKQILNLIIVGGLSATAAAILFLFDPLQYSLFPPCPFHAMTGLWCPGCGSLRGLHALCHGNLAQAIRWNPLTMAALPFLGSASVVRVLQIFGKEPLIGRRSRPVWTWMLLGVILAFWVLRNIPVYPFTLLAP